MLSDNFCCCYCYCCCCCCCCCCYCRSLILPTLFTGSNPPFAEPLQCPQVLQLVWDQQPPLAHRGILHRLGPALHLEGWQGGSGWHSFFWMIRTFQIPPYVLYLMPLLHLASSCQRVCIFVCLHIFLVNMLCCISSIGIFCNGYIDSIFTDSPWGHRA